MKTMYCLTVTLILSTITGSIAQAQHTDAFFAVGPTGKLVAGQYDFDSNSVLNVNTRVYEGEFEGPFSNVWTVDEPGFNALPNTSLGLPSGYMTLPSSTAVTFNANAFTIGASTSNLWHWDGSGSVSFAAVTGPTVLEISKSPTAVFSSVLDGSASDVSGFEIETTATDGFLHKHIDFSVSNTDATAPDAGFYLWAMTFHVGPSLETDLTYFVHGLGIADEAAHEIAISFVESALVPEPTSAVLLAGFGGLALRRRRHTVST